MTIVQFSSTFIAIHIAPNYTKRNIMDQQTEVYLRTRPSTNCGSVIQIQGDAVKVDKDEYPFNKIYGPLTTQADIDDSSIREFVESSTSFTAIAYGCSGSGKSFTMVGDAKQPGMIPRALQNIFSCYNVSSEPIIKPFGESYAVLNNDQISEEKRKRE